MELKSRRKESSRSWRSRREAELQARINFKQNSIHYRFLKLSLFLSLSLSLSRPTRNACLPRVTAYTQVRLVFHWPLLTPMQCLLFTGHALHQCNVCLFIGHGLHPPNTCFSLVTDFIYALLVFHWPLLTPMQCLLFTGHALHQCNACLFIGHSLHPPNTCFSLVTDFIYALLVFHSPLLTPTQLLFSIVHSLHPRIPCFR